MPDDIALNSPSRPRSTSHPRGCRGMHGLGMFVIAFAVELAIMLSILSMSRAQDLKPNAAQSSRRVVQDNVSVDEQTARVIHGGLKYLANHQNTDGSWSTDQKAAICGYCLISFLANGETPDEGEFGKTVNRGMQFLMSCVRPDGYIADADGQSNMYGHGISSIALAELFGMTKDANLRPKLEKAIKLIVSCQNSQGGWRYAPTPADADISVTVLQVVALRAAKNSGIDVPQVTIDNAVRYVKSCSDRTGGFVYQTGRQPPGFARTAAAIYSLQVCGLYSDPLVQRGKNFLKAYRDEDTTWFSYGNFYAAPALYMIGGDDWKEWYGWVHSRLMNPDLLANDGNGVYHWTPLDAGRYPSGEIYATAVYSMILAMPYHYIPLYQR